MQKRKLLTAFLLALSFSLFSQTPFSEFDQAAQQEDVIILKEVNTITVTDQRIDFMWFVINKQIRYKILTEAGINRISRIILPERLDPGYISHFPQARNFTHAYSKMRVDKFTARIIRAGMEERDAEVAESTEDLKMLMTDLDYYGDYKKFHYQIQNLEPGDELLIDYEYTMPYDNNFLRLSNMRIFFHSDLYKKHYQLNIRHHPELYVDLQYINGEDSAGIEQNETFTTHQWNYENLFGCLDEPGSRPHLTLPYVLFTPKPYDLNYTVAKSFEQRFTPFYVTYSKIREHKHPAITLSVNQGVKTKQYLQIRNFIEKELRELPDSASRTDSVGKLIERISDEFKFDNDLEYFIREDVRDPQIGDQIGNRTLRDLVRNDLYYTILSELNLNFFTCYLTDNRSGILSDNYFYPMYDNELAFSIYINDDKMSTLIPKKSRYGYYLDELPFYYENTRGRLVHWSDYIRKETRMNEGFRQIITPKSLVSDNIRTSRIAVNVNLAELKTSFQAQVFLSGQFSTMTRGLYLFGEEQQKVNPLYNKRIWEINPDINVLDQNLEIRTKRPPFSASLKARYESTSLIKQEGNLYELDLTNWFNHIIYTSFRSEYRQQEFYPDFSNRDSYLYFIQFDENIQLKETIEPLEISTDVMNLTIKVDQMSPNSIKIESFFAITGKIELDQMKELEHIFSALENLNKSHLLFSVE